MSLFARVSLAHRIVFIVAAAAAVAFALYTQHVWEDYYITFRSSKNLATGYGLVYNHGDRLHTFTSPLGVLLPALSSLLTLNRSDTAALWLFRAMSIAAFAGAAVFIYACFVKTGSALIAAVLAAACLAFDAKSLDFTINGMETGFLLLFIATTLWCQFAPLSRRWLWLGLSWGGLMWTRPDGFIYIALLAAGAWLFNSKENGYTRTQWIKICMLAGLVCTCVYLPWFLGSWWYYGSPIPHTVVAKAALADGPRPLIGAVKLLLKLPLTLWTEDTALPGAFLPAYYVVGGWPAALFAVAKALAFIAAFGWLVPGLGAPTRTASLAFCGFEVYLSYYPYFPFPWYQPGAALLGSFALAGIVARLLRPSSAPNWLMQGSRGLAWVLTAVILGFHLWTTPSVAQQLSAQQRWDETGNRRRIGEWLHQHAQPTDTVFMEPLGYIGYFSQLKTYDFPGMSARETPRAIHDAGRDWGALIDYLEPTWLVLRPYEAESVQRSRPSLFNCFYRRVENFDVSDELRQLDVHGRNYLEIDARFAVYERQPLKTFKTDWGVSRDRFPPARLQLDGHPVMLVHAPGDLTIKVPPDAREVNLSFGFAPNAEQGDPHTDGATFAVKLHDSGHKYLLCSQTLNPTRNGDRGIHFFRFNLSPHSPDAELILQIDSGVNSVKDWTCWGEPRFQ